MAAATGATASRQPWILQGLQNPAAACQTTAWHGKGLMNSRTSAGQDEGQPLEGPHGSKNWSIKSLRDLNRCTQTLTSSRQTITTLVQLCTALGKMRVIISPNVITAPLCVQQSMPARTPHTYTKVCAHPADRLRRFSLDKVLGVYG